MAQPLPRDGARIRLGGGWDRQVGKSEEKGMRKDEWCTKKKHDYCRDTGCGVIAEEIAVCILWCTYVDVGPNKDSPLPS